MLSHGFLRLRAVTDAWSASFRLIVTLYRNPNIPLIFENSQHVRDMKLMVCLPVRSSKPWRLPPSGAVSLVLGSRDLGFSGFRCVYIYIHIYIYIYIGFRVLV